MFFKGCSLVTFLLLSINSTQANESVKMSVSDGLSLGFLEVFSPSHDSKSQEQPFTELIEDEISNSTVGTQRLFESENHMKIDQERDQDNIHRTSFSHKGYTNIDGEESGTASVVTRQLTSSNYVLGNVCSNPITTSASCQTALSALGISYISDTTYQAYNPAGCYKYLSIGYWNSYTYSSCTSTYKCLCVDLSASTYYYATSLTCSSYYGADSRTLDFLPTSTMCTAGATSFGYSSITIKNSYGSTYPSGCYLDTSTSIVYLNVYLIGGYYGTSTSTSYMEVAMLLFKLLLCFE